jgi:UDP-N-acetylmuramate--alanine ligase
VGLELDLPFERIATGLEEFKGAERRFEVRGEIGGVLVVDDYGHHPTEIAAVMAAAKTLGRRVVVAFQPHRYSRTAAQMDAFGPSLAGADRIVLTDIYAAGEEPIPGATLERLAAAVRASAGAPVDVVPLVEDVAPVLAGLVQPGDLVITLGAGSIGTVPDRLIGLLSRAEASEIARKKRS